MAEEIKYVQIDREALEGPALSYAVSLLTHPQWGEQFRIWVVLPGENPSLDVCFLPHVSWRRATSSRSTAS